MNHIIKDILAHTGVARRSGRYPWGSGDNPHQRTGDFLSRVDALRETGKSETEVARMLGLSSTEYRIQKSLAVAERRKLLSGQ